jgi:hypothetical protein
MPGDSFAQTTGITTDVSIVMPVVEFLPASQRTLTRLMSLVTVLPFGITLT